jgi:hypothetical protein
MVFSHFYLIVSCPNSMCECKRLSDHLQASRLKSLSVNRMPRSREFFSISTRMKKLKITLASVTMSSMKKNLGEHGEMDVLLIPVILLAVFFVAAGSFAVWAYSGRENYKNNTDQIVASAVAANTKTVQTQDAQQYAQEAKSPLTVYVGPDAYGSVQVSYPKTWSAYVDTTNTNTPLDAYFHEGYVPSTDSQQTYNLRVQVNSQSYSQVLSQYSSQIQAGQITAVPYSFPKVPSIVGTELTGAIVPNNPTGQGVLILVPLRSTTLEVWTESDDYLSDFNTYILPNLTFSP